MASIARPPHGLHDIVRAAAKEHKVRTTDTGDEHPQEPPIVQPDQLRNGNAQSRSPQRNKESNNKAQSHKASSLASQAKRHTGTPSGIPRSFSYNYSASLSRPTSRANSDEDNADHQHFLSIPSDEELYDDPDHTAGFSAATSPFRGALEYQDPEQREREKEIMGKRLEKGKKRESGYFPAFDPRKWITDSPQPEPAAFSSVQSEDEGESSAIRQNTGEENRRQPQSAHPASPRPTLKFPSKTASRFNIMRRSKSLPHIENGERPVTSPKWSRLRSLLPQIAAHGKQQGIVPSSAVVSHNVNITDELMVGGLSTLMLKLWFERDERGHRRVPVLLHRLRIRVTDSIHPLHGHKAVFRIECEYANGAARWVIYRQLREFVSLHTHYAFSNAYNRNVETLPDFPRAGLPYFNFLRERGIGVSRAEFAKLQREALENYLIGLIRAVMFHPTANRLASFLEISALGIALAQSGGAQYKAGFLRIEAVGNKGPFGKRGTAWTDKKKQKWCAVRESYLVVLEEMGELTVHDVFLVDSDFKIHRPTRYYRQGLKLLHPDSANGAQESEEDNDDAKSTLARSIRSRISKVFHRSSHSHHDHSRGGTEATGSHMASPRSSRQRRSSLTSSSSDDSDDEFERRLTPILDPSTNTNPLNDRGESGVKGKKTPGRRKRGDVSKHTFYVENSQMKLKLYAKNERQMLQWVAALERIGRESHYVGKNRFDSFAPIRLNVAAQWLVDGRDYFWNLSRAILLAKECIYIHDWWLSPELQMRRPHMDKYRLDHLLERKAKEGVKIYVILYQEVSSRTTPTDSNYAKQKLSSLHPNIMVQRSPSHFQTGTFYWAHHEKLCVIDQAISFMGGLDLCFGRWDTPQHVLTDDPDSGDPSDQIWSGKDYSNPRVTDFHTLSKPEEDMYDRGKIPRMPWHDVSMQMVGQPARDLARHFVQRWNYLLRIKNHTRPMPSLLPPSDFRPGELQALGLTGTCELQICRSTGPWSMGTADKIEHSIQNAYLKAIQMSEHFVYIENQFFISSTVVNEVKIENRIGDAIVHRIIRAHREGTPFKCCIVIPLLPGFTFPVDHSDASAIRIILECQNRTICRGPNSIFSRLRKEGIDPDNYIALFSLRNWAKLRGDVLTTEQVYIHAKVCIVDDRLAIIGSANINERSQRGDRDSEVAAVIRDTDMIDSTMAGKPFKVGRFAHTLRLRLMREHLGVDVDAMYEEDLMASENVEEPHEQKPWDPDVEQEWGKEGGVTHIGKDHHRSAMTRLAYDTTNGVGQALRGIEEDEAKGVTEMMRKVGLKDDNARMIAGDRTLQEERKTFNEAGEKEPGFASSVVPTLEEKVVNEQQDQADQAHAHASADQANGDAHIKSPADGVQDAPEARASDELYGVPAQGDKRNDGGVSRSKSQKSHGGEDDDKTASARTTLRKHLGAKLGGGQGKWSLPTPTPHVDPHGFGDPICDDFWKKVWVSCAVHNTEIYRKVFHAIPDDLVTTWKQYKEFIVHHERLNKPVTGHQTPDPVGRVPSESGDNEAPSTPGAGQGQGQGQAAAGVGAAESAAMTSPITHGLHAAEKTRTKVYPDELARESSDGLSTVFSNTTTIDREKDGSDKGKEKERFERETRQRKTSRTGLEPFDESEREDMERLLQELRGHLVVYPTRFLEGEDVANNFLFNADRLLPLPIYD